MRSSGTKSPALKPAKALAHEFVEFIPDVIEEGKIYVSMDYATAVHKCACGCGKEVVTPLSPTDWKLTFDGRTVSFDPSIGNWGFACRSHYWVTNSQVIWAEDWSQSRVDANRAQDRRAKENYHSHAEGKKTPVLPGPAPAKPWWKRLLL